MATILRVAGLDMTMSNLGAARFAVDLETMEIAFEDAFLVATEKDKRKGIRSNSDDLRRSQVVACGVRRITDGCDLVCAEVPSGAQSARAALSFGIAIGIMACLPVPLIQVMPLETKMASVGSKTATKRDVIAWAAALYPQAPWLLYERATTKHRAGGLHDDNEHMADACAVIHAGLRTEEFERARIMRRRAA